MIKTTGRLSFKHDNEDSILLNSSKTINEQFNLLINNGKMIWNKLNKSDLIVDITADELNLLCISSYKIPLSAEDEFESFTVMNKFYIHNFYEYIKITGFMVNKLFLPNKDQKNHKDEDVDFAIIVKSELQNVLFLIYVDFIKEDTNLDFYLIKYKDSKDDKDITYEDILNTRPDVLWFIMKILEDMVFVSNILYFNN